MPVIKKFISKIYYEEESNKSKEIDIKNLTCYYLYDIVKIEDFDFDFDNILKDKSYKNTLFYDIIYRTLFGSKPLQISFDEVDGFIRVYDGIIYLTLFVLENMMSFVIELDILLTKKVLLHMYFLIIMQKSKFSYDSLSLEKTLTLHNVIIFIKSVFNKYQNHNYFNIFIEKCTFLKELMLIKQMNQKSLMFSLLVFFR